MQPVHQSESSIVCRDARLCIFVHSVSEAWEQHIEGAHTVTAQCSAAPHIAEQYRLIPDKMYYQLGQYIFTSLHSPPDPDSLYCPFSKRERLPQWAPVLQNPPSCDGDEQESQQRGHLSPDGAGNLRKQWQDVRDPSTSTPRSCVPARRRACGHFSSNDQQAAGEDG